MNNGFQSGLERRLEILKNRQREELLDEVGQTENLLYCPRR